jgi:hypothetical protein
VRRRIKRKERRKERKKKCSVLLQKICVREERRSNKKRKYGFRGKNQRINNYNGRRGACGLPF